MRISPELILPSQNFLKPDTVIFIFNCIERGDLDRLPPPPIVRRGDGNELIAIDGHNLIAVKLYRKEDIEVHPADSAIDGLLTLTEANVQRNKDLYEKFELAVSERNRLYAEGVMSFWDLIKRYPELFL